MGGVNLVEESQKILASNAEIVGTQIRSCKDESFLFPSALQRKILSIGKLQFFLIDTIIAFYFQAILVCNFMLILSQ